MGLFNDNIAQITQDINQNAPQNILESIEQSGIFLNTGAAEERELLRQFQITQENLRPALETAQRQLPGISQQVDPSQFGATLNQIGGGLERFLDPTRAARSAAGIQQLQLAGLSPGGAVGAELGQIDPSTFANLLLGAEQDVFSTRLGLSGLGQGAGQTLSELGQRTGQTIAQSQFAAEQQEAQQSAQRQSNILGIAGLGVSFLSDERLKDNIQEHGKFKGLRIISWKWKECVPESWRGMESGFSAQDVLKKYPQFVHERNGFLTIDKNGLMQHLGVI